MNLKASAAFVLAVSLLGCGPTPEVQDISPESLLARRSNGKTLILDVRTPEEFASGHVPGAVNIPYDQVSARLSELEPHRGNDIVIYCEKGWRAGKAADALAGANFPNLLHLAGDMSEWRAAGHPASAAAATP